MFLGNQAARPVSYVKKQSAGYTTRKSFASTTMIVSGLWLLVFIVIHAKTFRDGWGHQYEWAPADVICIDRRWKRFRVRSSSASTC